MAAALRLLTGRDRSAAELTDRLRRKGFSAETVAETMRRCRDLGYIDDERFAHGRAAVLMGSGRAVGRRLLDELRRRGVDEATAGAAVTRTGEAFDQETLLEEVLRRRFPQFMFRTADLREKRRVLDFFRRRGFSLPVLLSFFEKREADDHHDHR
jgi:regulatory protein